MLSDSLIEYYYLNDYKDRGIQMNTIQIVTRRLSNKTLRVWYKNNGEYFLDNSNKLHQFCQEYKDGLIKLQIERI